MSRRTSSRRGSREVSHLEFARLYQKEYRYTRRFWPERGRWMAWRQPFDQITDSGDSDYGWVESRAAKHEMGKVIESATGDRGRWCLVSHIRGSLELAAERMEQSEWDTDPDLLGLPSTHLVDLRTGECRRQERTDWLTMRAGCQLADRESPEWSRFVLEACGHDQEMAEALQLAVGASAFGHNRDHRVEVLCGDGGTGKSVFAGTLAAAFGAYAGQLSASVLNSRAEQHPTGVAALVGKRFVTVPEVTGGTFKAETLKALSGGDEIPARYMRQDFFAFRPACNLWLMTNEPPALRTVDNALRRRLRIWPFESIPTNPDPKLPERLRSPEALPGVLLWIVKGAAAYAALDGPLPDCRVVREATAQYFEATDSLGAWFGARCSESTTEETPFGALFKSYIDWCEAEDMPPVSRTALGTWMGRRATKRHTRRGNVYRIALVRVNG